MAFRDDMRNVVLEVLGDPLSWPLEMTSAIPQLVAQSPVAVPQIAGDVIASGTKTSTVTATGTTFATGTDVLATPLSFTAQGNNDYLLTVIGESWHNSAATNQQLFRINLDGADYGAFGLFNSPGAGYEAPLHASGVVVKPSTGGHTINARLITGAGTATILAAAGGAVGGGTPILVTLYRI